MLQNINKGRLLFQYPARCTKLSSARDLGRFYQVPPFNCSLNYIMVLFLVLQVWWTCSPSNLLVADALRSKTSDLYKVVQRYDEPLRDYLNRFNREKVSIPRCDAPTTISLPERFTRRIRFVQGIDKIPLFNVWRCPSQSSCTNLTWGRFWHQKVSNFLDDFRGNFLGNFPSNFLGNFPNNFLNNFIGRYQHKLISKMAIQQASFRGKLNMHLSVANQICYLPVANQVFVVKKCNMLILSFTSISIFMQTRSQSFN